MSDDFGAAPIPAVAPTTEPVTDPALATLLAFVAAVFNAQLAEAWSAVCPGKRVVEAAHAVDPETVTFVDRDLPALYAHRAENKAHRQEGDDWRVAQSTIVLWWVPPSTKQAIAALRSPFVNGLMKALDRALRLGRDPSWVAAAELDPTARTLAADADAILLSKATSASAQSYSALALDGAVGPNDIAPPRAPTITLGGSAGAFVVGSQILLTGLDLFGYAISQSFAVQAPPVVYQASYAWTHVTSIDAEAQAGAGGTITAGLGAYQGRGSVLLRELNALSIAPQQQGPEVLKIKLKGSSEAREYPAVRWELQIRERLDRDTSSLAGSALEGGVVLSGSDSPISTFVIT